MHTHRKLLNEIRLTLKQEANVILNKNQWRDIQRLLFEIYKRSPDGLQDIIQKALGNPLLEKAGGRNKFFVLKNYLIRVRFPESSSHEKIDTKTVYLSQIKDPLTDKSSIRTPFSPEHIFVEKKAKESTLVRNCKAAFPKSPLTYIDYYSEYLKTNPFKLKDLKKPILFIVSQSWDFLKPCPCTRHHIRCNYWIFNLGMGCPFDCTYCFLQQYTNFPGILLPANLNAFFDSFNAFYKEINRPIRIGTGEFCDSLALDNITGYASELAEFFKHKNLFFELKTKSDNIANLVSGPSSKNIVISWSLNPQPVIDTEEKGTASLQARFRAAQKVRNHGFSLAFHFDPIIYSDNWRALYENVICGLYKELQGPFQWISLGALRGTRKLKNAAEQRFPESSIFYGELLLGEDKKLRYPKFLRKKIYEYMVQCIRTHDKKTPVYLCMEDAPMWQVIGRDFTDAQKVERYLLGNDD